MKKFSLVMAVWNGSELVENVLLSVFDIDYPKKDFEVVVVDDGSKDSTPKILDKLKSVAKAKGVAYRVYKLKKNTGRVNARMTAAKYAKNERIMILDHTIEAEPDILKNASKYKDSEHLISNIVVDKNRSIDDRVYYLIRKKLYSPYFGRNIKTAEITNKNFDRVAKGTGGFVTNKKLFLKLSHKLNDMAGFNSKKNEDTGLFHDYIDNGHSLKKASDIRFLYKNRIGLDSLKHTFLRGPKFVGHYFKEGKIANLIRNNPILSFAILLIPLILISLVVLMFVYPLATIAFLSMIWLFNALLAFYLAEDGLDVLACFVYFPLIAIFFGVGVLNGLRIHYLS